MTDDLENGANASSSDSSSVSENPTRNFSDDIKAQRTESEVKTDSSEKSEKTDELSNQDIDNSKDSDVSQAEQANPEKVVLTKAEIDAKEMRIREIEHRKAKREAEKEYKERLEQLKQQTVQQPYAQNAQQGVQQNIPPQPSPSHIWDPTFNQWLDPNISIQDYLNLANQSVNQYAQQPIQNQQNYQNQQVSAKQQQTESSALKYSDAVMNQFDECMVDLKDFESSMKGAPVSPEMVEAACVDSHGMKNLYQMMKDAPHEIYQISKLSPHEQQHRMWLMNRKFADERANKLKTKATQQAAPLNNTGEVSKPESALSYRELKKKRLDQHWKSNS